MRHLILPALFALSACNPQVRLAAPPVEYLECKDWPKSPDLPAQSWVDIAAAKAVAAQRDALMLSYVQSGYAAWADCKSKVAGIKAWAEEVE